MSIKVMTKVWELDLPSEEQSVLLAMADHADDNGSNCYPSVPYLAWKTGRSDRSIIRIMIRLKDKRLIVPVAYIEGGRGHATEYQIQVWAGVPKPFYQRKGDVLSPFIKGDTGDIERVTPVTQRVTPVTLKGDAGVTPTIIEPSKNHHKESSKDKRPKKAVGFPLNGVFDAFRDAGLQPPPMRAGEPRSCQHLLQAGFSPGDIAQCWKDMLEKRFEPWRSGPSFSIFERDNTFENWQHWVADGRPTKGGVKNGRGNTEAAVDAKAKQYEYLDKRGRDYEAFIAAHPVDSPPTERDRPAPGAVQIWPDEDLP